jgi:L-lactate dehydrogenase complex protein LldE
LPVSADFGKRASQSFEWAIRASNKGHVDGDTGHSGYRRGALITIDTTPLVTISLFITCYNDTLFPETGKAVVAVLERLGHKVEFLREQTCCGQMHYNSGYHRDAARLMHHFLDVFEKVETICVPSSSCVSMIRDHFPKLAEKSGDSNDGRRVEELLPRVFEFSELLVDKLGVEDTGAVFPHVVTFHSSCHGLRSLQLGDKPARLLKNVRGIKLMELPESDQCCGFGGLFAIKNADVSAAMLSDKVQSILSTGAEVCTACDNSCLMHIYGALHRQRTGIRTLHLAEILAATR